MNHETLIAAVVGALGAAVVGILGYLGVRRQAAVSVEQAGEEGLRKDLAAARTECDRQQRRAEVLQDRMDAERAASEARMKALSDRNDQLESANILLRRTLHHAGLSLPRGTEGG